MYLDYFSLERHPFRITPDPSLFYSGGDDGRGVVLDAMVYAIETGEGIIKVVGEVGSGKTMLCRMLEERLPESTEIVYIANPNLAPDEILYAVAFELKLPVRRDTTKLLVMQQLQGYLLKQHAANKKVLVIIEEAQGMPVETLEEIRLFSNLETHRDKLMQIVLFGQPELDRNLSAKNIRQLRERITHSFYLSPLQREEIGEYIRFRLGAAGCSCPRLFTNRAEWLITKASGGLTRRINILADKALLAAFADNVLESPENLSPDVPPVVTVRHVYAAIRDSEYSSSILKSFLAPLRWAGAATLLIAVVLTYLMWPQPEGMVFQPDGLESTLDSNIPTAAIRPVNNLPITLPTETESKKLATTLEVEQPPESVDLEATVEETEPVATLFAETDLLRVDSGIGFTVAANLEASPVVEFAPLQAMPGNAKSLTQQRLLASVDWLQQSDKDGYTVQFLSGETNNLEFAESFLEELSDAGLIADSYVCMSTLGNRSYWTIKHGNFPGLSVAQAYIDKLPAQFHDYQPFVQNMSIVECNTNNTFVALILE